MLGFAALCEVPLCGLAEVGPPPVVTLPPEALAQLYGGRAIAGKKRRREEEEVSLEEMVRAIAIDPDLGKKAVVAALPKRVQRELLPDLPIVPDYWLVDEVQAASAAVRARIIDLYQTMEEEEDDELMFMLL